MSPGPTWAADLRELREEIARLAARHGSVLGAWEADLRDLARAAGWPTVGSPPAEGRPMAEIVRRACALVLIPDAGMRTPALALPRAPWTPASLQAEFPDPELALLRELADETTPAALRARVHDLRWSLVHDERSGNLALGAYIEAALRADLGRTDQALAAGDALLRAATLGLERRDEARVEAALRELLPRAIEQAPAAALHLLMQAAEKLRGLGRMFLANLAISQAELALTRRDFTWSRAFYGHAGRALADAGQEGEAQTLAVVCANVLAEQARTLRSSGEPPWVSTSFLERALDEVRLVPGSEELATALERELSAIRRDLAGPPGVEQEDGRLATVLEEVLRTFECQAPLLRWRFVGLLPCEPQHAEALPAGPLALDLFLRRLGERAHGRIAPQPATQGGSRTRVDPALVRAWRDCVLSWYVPVIEALRRRSGAEPRLLASSREHLFAHAVPGSAERAAYLSRGLEACWDGRPQLGIQALAPELERLRTLPAVRALLDASPDLALVDAAVLDHPEGLGLTELCERGEAAGPGAFTQASADLLLWWALALLYRTSSGPRTAV